MNPLDSHTPISHVPDLQHQDQGQEKERAEKNWPANCNSPHLAATTVDPEIRAAIEAEIARCWPAAQAHWSRFLLLGQPTDGCLHSVAQINLNTREVTLNFAQIHEKNLQGCIEALLAHEIGHHVKYPGTLAVDARMRLLEKALIPFEEFTLTNLFTDLMINEYLGQYLKDQLCQVYRAFTNQQSFHHTGKWKADPSFIFYMAIYEELWHLEQGHLMGSAYRGFESEFPGYRAEAQLLGQNLFSLGPNLFTQFLYFVSILTRYVKPLIDDLPHQLCPYQCEAEQPSPEDWAKALHPNEREREAIRKALEERWFDEKQARRLNETGDLEDRISRLPGFGTDNAQLVPDVMANWYRQQAEAFLFRPPPQRRQGEAVVPTTHEDWEMGDCPREIDWQTTLTLRGPVLGTIQPMKRTLIAEDEGFEVPLWQARMEIYLDVSGSMPDPRRAANAMTLAAQILTLGTTRGGGWVRALLYSGDFVSYWDWCRSDREISQFLMHYIGSGTEFPFDMLARSVKECGGDQPIRVIISDTDFDHNYKGHKSHSQIFADAARVSPALVLMQHRAQPEPIKRYRADGAQVIEVADMQDFPRMAAQLAFALFPEGHS